MHVMCIDPFYDLLWFSSFCGLNLFLPFLPSLLSLLLPALKSPIEHPDQKTSSTDSVL